MIRKLFVLSFLLIAGCVAPAALRPESTTEAVDIGAFSPLLFEQGFVFGFLDAQVDATLSIHSETFLPLVDKPLPGVDAAAIPEKFPTILVMSPYFGAGQGGVAPGHAVYGWLVNNLTARGYAVVLADTAGTGGSSGCWDFMGPNEVRGTYAMVETIAAQPWSDGNVGMIGKSYDGMTQIMAGTAAPPALKTIVPVAPLTHSYGGILHDGVHYGGGWHLTTTLYHQISLTPPVGSEERYPGYAVRTIETPTCIAQNTLLGNDASGSYNAYFQERDFRPKASAVTASVFFIQGFLDPAVKPDNMLPFFADITTAKKAWVGQWEHDYPNAEMSGREDMFLTLQRWFDHELKGIDNGIDREPMVDVQDSLGAWRHEATWPPADATLRALYPSGDGTLGVAAGSGEASFGGPAALLSLAGNGLEGIVEFSGEPLAADMHISGVPRIELTLASDKPAGTVVARLYEVNDSSARRIAQGALNLQFVGGLTTPMPLVPTMPVKAVFDLYPTDYIVRAGSHLVLRLQTVDEDMWFDPDASGATLTLSAADSVLHLPTVDRAADATFLTACGARIKDAVPSCYTEGRVDRVVG